MSISTNLRILLFSLMMLLLGACDQAPNTNMTAAEVPKRHFDPAQLQLGAQVFQSHCQRCHGEHAEGNPQWRKAGADGKYPPPPLNGSGHAWHHSRAVLKQAIVNGSMDSMGNMPPMGKVLSEKEVDAVISWFQSLWPDQVYASWYEMQKNAAQ